MKQKQVLDVDFNEHWKTLKDTIPINKVWYELEGFFLFRGNCLSVFKHARQSRNAKKVADFGSFGSFVAFLYEIEIKTFGSTSSTNYVDSLILR